MMVTDSAYGRNATPGISGIFKIIPGASLGFAGRWFVSRPVTVIKFSDDAVCPPCGDESRLTVIDVMI